MKEDFLQFIWEHRLFENTGLRTEQGEQLEIITVGQRNVHSGPDFFNAHVKIGTTLWAGNVEIHQKSSHWRLHRHGSDAAYDNVVLHVVEIHDEPVVVNGHEIPTLVIRYPLSVLANYEQLAKSGRWVPCEEQLPGLDPFIFRFWSGSLTIERLELKTGDVQTLLEQNKNNWNETFYQLLAKNFGMKANSLPFELLAKSLPSSILAKHKNNLLQLEALLFGQSGLLDEAVAGDAYYLSLREEYSHLSKKYQLSSIGAHLWKFMRMRPVNFPTIRIAQLAMLTHRSSALFSRILETEDIDELSILFNVTASAYWDSHYQFNKTSGENKKKTFGETAFQNLAINTIVPMLFAYGEQHAQAAMKDRALALLEKLPPESNHIIKKWDELGIRARSAFETQALLQLKNGYCEPKRCLQCQIGARILVSGKT